MKTRIRCPACDEAYLMYHKVNLGDIWRGKAKVFWRCEGAHHISFDSTDLRLVLKVGGIDIDSVNYPKRLHITAEGVTAG